MINILSNQLVIELQALLHTMNPRDKGPKSDSIDVDSEILEFEADDDNLGPLGRLTSVKSSPGLK